MKGSKITLFILFSIGLVLSACGPRAFTDGAYSDPEEVALLDDQFNENDMQLMANKLTDSLIEFRESRLQDDERPVVMVGRVRNRTSEHIDMKALTDSIRTALIQTGEFRFADKAARDELAQEYEYQAGEYVDQDTAVQMGQQIGVEYIITGDLSSNIQEVGNQKIVYYRITMNLIDVATNIIEWSDDREIRKRFRKQSVGL